MLISTDDVSMLDTFAATHTALKIPGKDYILKNGPYGKVLGKMKDSNSGSPFFQKKFCRLYIQETLFGTNLRILVRRLKTFHLLRALNLSGKKVYLLWY